MRTIVVQKDINRTDLVPFLNAAREREADLVCFGELATSGCLTKADEVPPLPDLLTLLQGYPFRILTGIPLATPAGLYNTCLYCHGSDYRLYHKINLFPPFDEPDIFLPGREVGIWDTDMGLIGVAICYDIRFDDIFRKMKSLGVEMIVIPAAFPRVRIAGWRDLLRKRAKEAEVPVIGINAVGYDGRNEFGGCSAVVSSSGDVIVEADQISETLLEVDL